VRTAKKLIVAKDLLRRPTKTLGFMNVILLDSNHQHVLATRGHLQGGENKNTNTNVMCQNRSTVKDCIVFLLKFTVE
jgi:hypothetical protein